jgi:hypothetical protein
LYIPPPLPEVELALNIQLINVGLLVLELYIPPPEPKPMLPASLPMKEQLVTVGLLEEQYIPPPLPSKPGKARGSPPPPQEPVEFWLNVQLVTLGDEL